MTVVLPSARRNDDRADSALRLVSVALLAGALACIVVLHLVRRDLAPARHRISEYAIGPYGELMAASFISLGAGLLALARPLARASARRSRVVLVVVAAAGAGMVISGIFRTDPERSGVTTDAVHSYASAFSTMALIGTALLCSLDVRAPGPSAVTHRRSARHSRRDPGRSESVPAPLAVDWRQPAAALADVAGMVDPHRPTPAGPIWYGRWPIA